MKETGNIWIFRYILVSKYLLVFVEFFIIWE